jgi:hypothetical protein
LATALVPRHIKTRILYKRNIYLTHFSDFVSDVLWSLDLFCGRYELHGKLILPHEIHTVKKRQKLKRSVITKLHAACASPNKEGLVSR